MNFEQKVLDLGFMQGYCAMCRVVHKDNSAYGQTGRSHTCWSPACKNRIPYHGDICILTHRVSKKYLVQYLVRSEYSKYM